MGRRRFGSYALIYKNIICIPVNFHMIVARPPEQTNHWKHLPKFLKVSFTITL